MTDRNDHEHLKDAQEVPPDRKDERATPNPPRTTKGGVTAPKFGSAGSGGAEIEPGIKKD